MYHSKGMTTLEVPSPYRQDDGSAEITLIRMAIGEFQCLFYACLHISRLPSICLSVYGLSFVVTKLGDKQSIRNIIAQNWPFVKVADPFNRFNC